MIQKNKPLTIKTLNGIGDLCWLMVVINNLKKIYKIPKLTIKLQLAGDRRDDRALKFIKKFKNVDDAFSERFDIFKQPIIINKKLNYINEGYRKFGNGLGIELWGKGKINLNIEYTYIINTYLEKGIRIEEILPDVPVDWNILKESYEIDKNDTKFVKEKFGKEYICFHLGCLTNNTVNGMNREETWNYDHWYQLAKKIRKISDLPIFIVGAFYDKDYSQPFMKKYGKDIENIYDVCGETDTTQLIEMLRDCKLLVSFASGVAISAVYMYIPTVMFWMPEKYSVSPWDEIHFSDNFATAWIPPNNKYYPAYYHKDSPTTVFKAIQEMELIL